MFKCLCQFGFQLGEQCGGQIVVFQEERSSEITAGGFFRWLIRRQNSKWMPFLTLACVCVCVCVHQKHSNCCLALRLSNQRPSGKRGERYLNFPLRKLSHYVQFALIPLAWLSRPSNESILPPPLTGPIVHRVTFDWLIGTFVKEEKKKKTRKKLPQLWINLQFTAPCWQPSSMYFQVEIDTRTKVQAKSLKWPTVRRFLLKPLTALFFLSVFALGR